MGSCLNIAILQIFIFSTTYLKFSSANSTSKANIIYTCGSSVSSAIDTVTIPGWSMITNTSQVFSGTYKDLQCDPAEHAVSKTSLTELDFRFYSTGEINFNDTEYLLHDDYCIKRIENKFIEIKYCKVECGVTHTCINKCCAPHEVIDFSENENGKCSKTNNLVWKPIFYDHHKGCGIRSQEQELAKYRLLTMRNREWFSQFLPYKSIQINSENKVVHREGDKFRLMNNGDLRVHTDTYGVWETFSPQEFCIDGMMGYVGSEHYSGDFSEQVFLDVGGPIEEAEELPETSVSADYSEDHLNNTSEHEDTESSSLKTRFYIFSFLIGAVFLTATVILYLLIWDKHNIHGWTIFAFVATMLLMFIFVATSHLLSIVKTNEFMGNGSCKGVGIASHFFYLSTMCWLTVINIDLWLTFRNLKPGRGKSQNYTRFASYMAFGYGIPILIVAFGVALDSVYYQTYRDGSECEPPVVLPLYGLKQCYIQDNAYWEFMYIPMGILISCNILTFSSTVFTLCMYRKQTRNAAGCSATHHKESLVLFVKLFVVAGISWVFEILSNAAKEPWWLWIIFDIYNLLLQGAFIFIIFALKRENIVFLYQKYPRARFLLDPIMRTRCCNTGTFDPERTEMTVANGVVMDKNSRISYRRGSNVSTGSQSKS